MGASDSSTLPPGPIGLPFLGSLLQVWSDPLDLLATGVRRFGDTVMFRFGPYRYVLVHKPSDVRHVLLGNHDNYTKSINYQGIKLLLGEGLLTSEGSFWRRQRKLAQPAFHHRHLVSFADTMSRCTEETLERWERRGLDRIVDVHDEMMRLTFRIVGLTLTSTDLEREARAMGEALTVALRFGNDYAESIVKLPLWLPTPNNVRFLRAKGALDATILGIIRERRASGEDIPDLLSTLMHATDEPGAGQNPERMTDDQLRDELMTMVLAGHETTANALTFTFYLLSRHPEVARRVEAEVDEVLAGRAPTFADLDRLTYTGWVIDEALRLYPPAWIFERQAIEADELDGYHVPAGTIVAVCPWTLHRHPAYWDNPEGFDPERFSDSEGRDRYTYMPFGGGPRMCIGNAFAKMEAKIVLASLLRRVHFELVPGTTLALEPSITLRPRGGLPMRLLPRRWERASREGISREPSPRERTGARAAAMERQQVPGDHPRGR
jgi:cytochrome P450